MWTVEIDSHAETEIERLPDDLKARFVLVVEQIQEFGFDDLSSKLVKKIGSDLWELRLKAASGIARALYFTVKPRRMFVVSAFVKKSDKLPLNEEAKAESRMKAWRQREAMKTKKEER